MVQLGAFAGPMVLGVGSRSYMGVALTSGVAALGTVSLAAHQIVDALYWLFAPFGDAVSLCMQAYMPELLNRSEASARKLRALGVKGAAILCGIVAAFGAGLVTVTPGLFCSAAAVHASMGSSALPLAGAIAFYTVAGALEGALTARRQLQGLALCHLLNTGFVVLALNAVLSSSAASLRGVWALMAAVNAARVLQFGALLCRAEATAAKREHAHLEHAEQTPMLTAPKRVLFLRKRRRAAFA